MPDSDQLEEIEDFTFKVVRPRSRITTGRMEAYLIEDRWNDYSFRTQFQLVIFDDASTRHSVGNVKIAFAGMTEDDTAIPFSEFKALSPTYFSLGMQPEYYERLRGLSEEIRKHVYTALRDMAYFPAIWDKFQDENVTTISLLRGVRKATVTDQFRRYAHGDPVPTDFHFAFEVPVPGDGEPYQLTFDVDQQLPLPPSNVHAIIGRNGVGKTFLLGYLLRDAIGRGATQAPVPPGMSKFKWGLDFIDIVSVSWSAFESAPEKSEQLLDQSKIVNKIWLYSLNEDGSYRIKTPEMLSEEFTKSIKECFSLNRINRWLKVIEILETDPGFSALGIPQFASAKQLRVSQTKRAFDGLSSGHKIVLLTLTRLVEYTAEKTIVLIDEPETHLHPPLLSAFVRALSSLMTERNGIAIVATHSPVVLQEIPKSCTWKLYRYGNDIKPERPTIETFGENIGTLTREVFGYDVDATGFRSLLSQVADERPDFYYALQKFRGQVGWEGQAILRGLIEGLQKSGTEGDA